MSEDPHTHPAPPAPEPTSEPTDVEPINGRKLLIQTIVGLVVLLVAIGILVTFFQEPLKALSRGFVDVLGLWGIGVGIFLADSVMAPLPHDVLMSFGLVGGLGFWSIILWATGFSLVGGTLGFFIGGRLGHTRWVQTIMTKRGEQAHQLVLKYGGLAVAIGALSPFPYSIVAWACGMLKMDFRLFFLYSLLRGPRFVIYLWLIEAGVLSMME